MLSVNIQQVLFDFKILFSRFAYVEFSDKDSVTTAQALDDSLFRGRQIKVRLNILYI